MGPWAGVLEMRTDLESLNVAYDERSGLGREGSGEQTQQTLVRNIVPEYLELWGFPGGSVVKNPPVKSRDIRDVGLIPGLGRSPGRGHGNSPVFLPDESPWTKEPGGATVHGVR